MKQELEILAPILLPRVPEAPADVTLTECRRLMNVSINELIHFGVYANKLEALSTQLMLVMSATCQTMVSLGHDAEVDDFIEATAGLATMIRHEMDEALRFNKEQETRICAVMLEILVKGVSATLGLPYAQLLDATAKGEPDYKTVLTASGHIKEES